jgi:alkylhydroperoxidase family enzyme
MTASPTARRRIAHAVACVTCTAVAVEAGSIEEKLAASHTWRPSDVLDEREKAMLWLRARLTRRAVSGAGAAPAGAGPPTSDDGGAAP